MDFYISKNVLNKVFIFLAYQQTPVWFAVPDAESRIVFLKVDFFTFKIKSEYEKK